MDEGRGGVEVVRQAGWGMSFFHEAFKGGRQGEARAAVA